MNNIFAQNSLNAIVFKLQVILLMMQVSVILTKCSKCNTFQVIIDLVHDFINFNALKLYKKFITKL